MGKEYIRIEKEYFRIFKGKICEVGAVRGINSKGFTRYLAEVKGKTECWLLIPTTGFFKEESQKVGEENKRS